MANKKSKPSRKAAKPAPRAARKPAAAASRRSSVRPAKGKGATQARPARRPPAVSTRQSRDGANVAAASTKGTGAKKKEFRPENLPAFEKRQWNRLVALRDSMLDSMSEVARDSLRSRAEGNEASAFGMHQADAGSDAYDRDFALSLLSQEQDALYEIDEALKRIEMGTYGKCEMSGKKIPRERLEAIPFARLTFECQSELERQRRVSARARGVVHPLFTPIEEEGSSEETEEDSIAERRE